MKEVEEVAEADPVGAEVKEEVEAPQSYDYSTFAIKGVTRLSVALTHRSSGHFSLIPTSK